MHRHEGQDLARGRRRLDEHLLEPGKCGIGPGLALGLARQVGRGRRDKHARGPAPDVALRLAGIVGRLRRHEHIEAVGGKAGRQQADTVAELAQRRLERAAVEEMGQVVPGVLVEDPVGKDAGRGGGSGVGIARTPHPVEADENRLRLRLGGEKQRGQLRLLPGAAVVQGEVGEPSAERRLQSRRVEQARGRGAEHHRVEPARAHDRRILKAIVGIHDDVRPEGAHRQIAVRVHDRNQPDGERQRHCQRRQRRAQETGPGLGVRLRGRGHGHAIWRCPGIEARSRHVGISLREPSKASSALGQHLSTPDLVASMEIDGMLGVAFEAGVEEA